ncbi:hypothetical protein OG225_26245 [Nocardia sp. NBC_01377]|uniref:hypothetical protein n=1 Tax=Nocardia sp. NBC_01377 TaxID=2903595 RepID=UPI00324E7431
MDPADHAQAQVFLDLLKAQAYKLKRDLARAPRDSFTARELEYELRTVQRFISRLQDRFPAGPRPN